VEQVEVAGCFNCLDLFGVLGCESFWLARAFLGFLQARKTTWNCVILRCNAIPGCLDSRGYYEHTFCQFGM